MSIRIKFLIGVLSLAGNSAIADATKSEFFYQTASGQAAGTIQAGYMDRELTADAGTQKDTGLTKAGIRYEMGLNDLFSLEGVLTYTMLTINPITSGQDNATINGIDNVQVNIKATNGGYTWGRLRYGAVNSIGAIPAAYTLTGGGSPNLNLNSSSGNYTFTPYIGADMDLGPGILGAKASYDLVKTDTVIHSPPGNATLLVNGGQDLTATIFYEWLMDQSLIGLAVDFMNESPANTLTGPNGSGFSEYGAKLYGRWGFADAWSIIPSVQYDIYATKSAVDMYSNVTISRGYEMDVALAARYAF